LACGWLMVTVGLAVSNVKVEAWLV